MAKREPIVHKTVTLYGVSYRQDRLKEYLNPVDTQLSAKHCLIIMAKVIKSCITQNIPLPWRSTTAPDCPVTAIRGSVFEILRELKQYGCPCGWNDIHDEAVAVGFEGVADMMLLAVTSPKQ